jgi:hypothetical protein
MQVTTRGLDLGNRVFQVHGVDGTWRAVIRRKLQRAKTSRGGRLLCRSRALPHRHRIVCYAHYWVSRDLICRRALR